MPSHFLKPGDFRFDMGLRRGSLDYFRNTGATSLLEERCVQLQVNPDNYAVALPGSEAMVRETVEFADLGEHDSMPSLGSTWEPDFVLLDEDLCVQAGCVCFPSFWSLPEKLGKSIAEVHAPVPGLNDQVGAKMQTFLHRLKPGEVWERWNWGLAATPELNCHPEMRRARLDASATLATTWFRVEHQALVRLPKTGAVLFGIRVLVSTLEEETREEPGFAALLRQQLASMPEAVANYKGLSACRAVLLEQL